MTCTTVPPKSIKIFKKRKKKIQSNKKWKTKQIEPKESWYSCIITNNIGLRHKTVSKDIRETGN